MFYYVVNRIGDGTRQKPFRPEIPNDINFIWADRECDTCKTFLLSSDTQIDGMPEVTNLQSSCESRDLNYSDVIKWFVGD